ncbi:MULTISPECIES: hypothetical protein [unclassified Streptomyces]|uniref:hypothetical protein n=1 Tax=unclassified Streptomyces TaxID=2593676 RepID=UPI00093BCC4F|nr:hypothetical protein [Streptomyces sp. CB02058]OKI91160.1 hypothetical protein AMK10_30200 [Streptomyces sp. CB02058]
MTGAFVAIAIVLIVVGGVAATVISYLRLQRHRADAVAMASYRKLAEEAVERQASLQGELALISERVTAVERLLRSVG